MMDNKIVLKNKEADCETSVLGISGENEQQRLIFSFEDGFVDGSCFLELELPDGRKGSIKLDKEDETYCVIVKNSLLTQIGEVKMQLKIIQKTAVWKSTIFKMTVIEAIKASETIEEDYPNWVEDMTIRMGELEEGVSQIAKDVSNLENYDDTEVRNEIEQVKKDTEGSIKEETDPTVPAWAKEANKPTYTASEVGALPADTALFSGNYEDLENKPVIPSVEGLASEEYVRQELGKVEAPDVDLTGYVRQEEIEKLASKGYVDEKIGDIDTILSSMADESEAI